MPVVNITSDQIKAGLTINGLKFLDPSLGQFTYSIPTAASTWPGYDQLEPSDPTRNYPNVSNSYQIFTPVQAEMVRKAIAAWDALIAPNFTESADSGATFGEIRFAFTDVPEGIAGVSNGGAIGVFGTPFADIWLDKNDVNATFALGSFDYITLLHEIGHSMGLQHSFTLNPPPQDRTSKIPREYETKRYTVMSYTDEEKSVVVRPSSTTNSSGNTINTASYETANAITPMVVDIAAIQLLYGADLTTRTGDDTYRFDQNAFTTSSIYDAGGNDTIDLSNFTRNSIVDLNEGAYSSIGLWSKDEQLAHYNATMPSTNWSFAFSPTSIQGKIYEWENNLGIAFGVKIENAIGGTGRDTLIGNALANRLDGGVGDDMLYGFAGDDLLLAGTGNDQLWGGDGNDGFLFGASYTSADVVNGEVGTLDQVGLQGDYSAGVTLGSLLGVEMVVLLTGNDARFGDQTGTNLAYNIVANASTVVSNNALTLQANMLRAGESFTFNGAASGINFLIYGGLGTDDFTGGGGNDGFYFGVDRFAAGDRVVGGAGSSDQLGLQGNYTVTFGADQISGIEFLVLLTAADARFNGNANSTYNYDITMNDGNVADGAQLAISANSLIASETLKFNGGSESNGRYQIFSGDGADVLIGGQRDDEINGRGGADRITGGLGADQLRGGDGGDTFVYLTSDHSKTGAIDQILDFGSGDTIDLSAIDASVLTGATNDAFTFIGSATFSGNGAAGQLRAVNNNGVWTVEGDTDGNGVADLIILVTTPDPLTELNGGSFVL